LTGYVIAVIGDTHIGSSTALSPLQFTIHNRATLEEQITYANRLQEWLYDCWIDYWDYVYHLCGKGKKGKRLIVIHLGDVIDGNHHGSNQLIQEVEDQVQIALDLLEPIRNKSHKFIGILGTMPFHAGQDHATELEIYKKLDADYIEQAVTINIDGILIDLAHHGKSGTRPWTTSAVSEGAEVMLDYAQQGQPLPNFILRGHTHKFDDSGAKFQHTRVIQCPSWQLKTAYGWRVSSNTVRSDIGGIIIYDGVLDLSRSRYMGQPDGRKIIKI